ncbi:MAG: LCP family protein [Oscillospiraceae bacterium]|nr:LCP family protein [Oscillospiraceae bacterium]
MKVKFNVKRYFQVLGISLAIVIAAAAVCMGIDFSGFSGEEVVDNTSTVEASGGKVNVLLMAVDSDGLRTDAIMLVSFDTETKAANIMSIPRDTRVYVGNRYQKINAAHAYVGSDGEIGGPTATCEVVTRITGIPINYYVDFSFDAVAKVIDELGTIEFTIPDLYGDGVGMVYDDPAQDLHINLPPGTYELNGEQAVQLMRYRHGNVDPSTGVFKGYTNGDSDRVAMQQEFIKAVIDQKLNASLILKIPSIFKTISDEIKTNFTVSDVIKYSKDLSGFSTENIATYELPGAAASAMMDGYRADVWEVDLEATRELVQSVFGYPADNITIDNPDDVDYAGTETTASTSSGTSSSGTTSSSTTSSGTSASSTSSSNSSSTSSSGSSSYSSYSSSNSSSGSSSNYSSGTSSDYDYYSESSDVSSEYDDYSSYAEEESSYVESDSDYGESGGYDVSYDEE